MDETLLITIISLCALRLRKKNLRIAHGGFESGYLNGVDYFMIICSVNDPEDV